MTSCAAPAYAMTDPTPYLHFPGTAREALTFYGEVFGCSVELHTFAEFSRDDGPAEAPVEADMVVPIPDSGTPAAIGFDPRDRKRVELQAGAVDNGVEQRHGTRRVLDLRDVVRHVHDIASRIVTPLAESELQQRLG